MGVLVEKTASSNASSLTTTSKAGIPNRASGKKIHPTRSHPDKDLDSSSSCLSKTETDLIVDELEEKIDIAKEYMRLWNDHDLNQLRKVLTNDFVSTKNDKNKILITWAEMKADAQKIFKHFPDFKMTYSYVEARSKSGTVVLGNVVASGKNAANDPTNVTIYFRNTLICRIEVQSNNSEDAMMGFHSPVGQFPAYLDL